VWDIVLAELQPVVGSDIGKVRLALMLTTKEFNCMGDVLIVPITLDGDYSRHRG
jgi:mRNA interferase ChpB